MSKGDGLKIGIKFTDDLVGDVIGNEPAFTITGQEYKHVNGPLIDGNYLVDKVERYPIQRVWEDDLGSGITLGNTGVPTSYTDDLVPLMTGDTQPSGIVSYNYQYSVTNAAFRIFDNNLSTRWATDTETVAWISYEFETEQQISKYSIIVHPTNSKTAPKNWKFEAMEGEQYVVLDERSNITWVNGEKKEFTFSNANKYKKYRLNITADNGGGWLSITEMELMGGIYRYDLLTEYTANIDQITGEYKIRWLEDKPVDTNIIIEYTTGATQGLWQSVSDGDIITSNTNLWIRATLSTVDTTITPILQDLWLEEPDAPQDKILITMDWWGKFNNVEGELTIAYDSTNGNLFGTGGPVESFEASFIPEDLIKRINPGHPHTFEVDLTADISFVKIYYKHRFSHETFSVHPDCFINFEYVGIINP